MVSLLIWQVMHPAAPWAAFNPHKWGSITMCTDLCNKHWYIYQNYGYFCDCYSNTQPAEYAYIHIPKHNHATLISDFPNPLSEYYYSHYACMRVKGRLGAVGIKCVCVQNWQLNWISIASHNINICVSCQMVVVKWWLNFCIAICKIQIE